MADESITYLDIESVAKWERVDLAAATAEDAVRLINALIRLIAPGGHL